MDKDKNTTFEVQMEQEFQEHVHKELVGCFGGFSKFDLSALKHAAFNKVKAFLFGSKDCSAPLQRDCERILNEPTLSVHEFCSQLFYMRIHEGGIQDPIRVSIYPHILALSQILFILGNIELGKIQHYSGDMLGGDGIRKAQKKYQLYAQAFGDPILDEALKTEEFRTLLKYIINAISSVRCRINPREVVECLCSSSTGRTLLPFTLAQFLEQEKAGKISTTLKKSNRSGSTINPEKHALTKEACQNAWKKIQEEQIIDLNAEKFSEIASSFLKPGQSLITTVLREFYKTQIPQEYKVGAGRKSK